jgi:hypothetical protein
VSGIEHLPAGQFGHLLQQRGVGLKPAKLLTARFGRAAKNCLALAAGFIHEQVDDVIARFRRAGGRFVHAGAGLLQRDVFFD